MAVASRAAAAATAVAFGYLAQSIAIDKGFPDSLIEHHEGLGVTTASVFLVLAILRFALPRFGIALEGRRGQIAAAFTVAGVALLLTTAYFGGALVYEHGVNVHGVKP